VQAGDKAGSLAVTDTEASQRRVALSLDRLQRSPTAAELVVHALAQLPDDVTGGFPGQFQERERVELLARAYGIEERVRSGTPAPADSRLDRMIAAKATFGEVVEELWNDDDEVSPPVRGDDSLLRGHRFGLVTNVPAHYRVRLFNAIGRRLEEAGARFVVFFTSRAATSRPWLTGGEPLGFEHEFLPGLTVPVRARPPRLPLTLNAALRRVRPTVLLSAGFSPAVSGRVERYARSAGIPFGVWSGEHDQMATTRSRLRAAQRRRLLSRADFAVAYGSASATYLHSLAPELPVVIGRNTAPLPAAPKAADSPNEPVHIVVVGDLADQRKGIDVVIDALRARPRLDCRVTVIGGGARLGALEARARSDDRVTFLGSRSPEETRRTLSAADVFLSPTRADIFGLALVEAMGAGVCPVVSSVAGAVPDLCVEGLNCRVIQGHDPCRWAEAIAEVTSDRALRSKLAARARSTIVRRWTVEHSADAIVAGLRLGVLTGARR
jgi:glycosyltransferase involved in cell wall biosynthesis